jgi:hypothetical protein
VPAQDGAALPPAAVATAAAPQPAAPGRIVAIRRPVTAAASVLQKDVQASRPPAPVEIGAPRAVRARAPVIRVRATTSPRVIRVRAVTPSLMVIRVRATTSPRVIRVRAVTPSLMVIRVRATTSPPATIVVARAAVTRVPAPVAIVLTVPPPARVVDLTPLADRSVRPAQATRASTRVRIPRAGVRPATPRIVPAKPRAPAWPPRSTSLRLRRGSTFASCPVASALSSEA